MVSYGSTSEPGITTDVESALTISTSGDAPTDVGIVGQADLDVGTATPNQVYQITRASNARSYFGEDSLLANAIVDALDMGAYPVYAVATSEEVVNGEDISGVSSTSGEFANSPLSEDSEDIQVRVDGAGQFSVEILPGGDRLDTSVRRDTAPDESAPFYHGHSGRW